MGNAKIAIASSFTAEPLTTVLDYWIGEKSLDASVEFAPFDQILPSLVDPTSLFFDDAPGLNVVLMRFEDLGSRGHERASVEVIEALARETFSAVKGAVERSRRPFLIVAARPSPDVEGQAPVIELCERLSSWLSEECEKTAGVFFLGAREIESRYPAADYYDAYGDREGRIPYTELAFAALATMIARRFETLRRRKPPKVIVLDCDQTLWKGVVGEDGHQGITIDDARRSFQSFIAEQKSYGMLLAMCSKNTESDVLDVYAHRDDMVLKREDFVAWRINWSRKSDNLREISEELQLGLDSFVFIDDDPVQCAEVRASCPGVTVLQMPQEAEEVARFAHEAWELDHAKVTKEDRTRTVFYFQNREREALKTSVASLDEYLKTLGLEILIAEIVDEQLSRVAQLTQRTNQFNCGNVKRTEAELKKLRDAGAEIHTVHLRDRFGDYGLVGATVAEPRAGVLHVDTFLLSCRALGRRVEHEMLAQLRRRAVELGLDGVELVFRATAKNRPAADFLADAKAPSTRESDGAVLHGFAPSNGTPA